MRTIILLMVMSVAGCDNIEGNTSVTPFQRPVPAVDTVEPGTLPDPDYGKYLRGKNLVDAGVDVDVIDDAGVDVDVIDDAGVDVDDAVCPHRNLGQCVSACARSRGRLCKEYCRSIGC